MKKSIYFVHILGLNFNISYQIVSLFDVYMDMGERIAAKQDRPSLNIGLYMKNWFSNCFPLLYIGLHCDEGCI